MVPPAPGRFSTTRIWPSMAPSRSVTARAAMSVPLPAVNGTITLIALVGQFCATAPALARHARHTRANAPISNGIRFISTPRSLYRSCCVAQLIAGADSLHPRPDLQWRHRQFGDRGAERIERIVDGAGDGGRRAEGAALARTLLPESRERRRRAVIHDRNRRYLERGRNEVVHERLALELAVVAVGELLIQRRADAVRDAAIGHAVHVVRTDHHAAIVAADIAHELRLTGCRIDLDQHHVRLERETRVHLDAPVGRRQSAPADGRIPMYQI